MASTALQIIKKRVPAVRVISLREVVADYKSQGPLWMRLGTFARENKIEGSGEPCQAIFHDQGFKPVDVDTEVVLPIKADAVVPSDLKEFKVYELAQLEKAASVTHKGSYDGLMGVYNGLFEWIAAEKEQVIGPVREVYHVMPGPGAQVKEADYVTEIQVPLK